MDEPPKTPIWEPVAIIVAILALLPKILAYAKGRTWPWAEVLMYAAGVVMIVVFICKARRFQKLWQQHKKD